MELIDTNGLGHGTKHEKLPSQELLQKRPNDPRAWHCKTVEEYRLFKYSSNYGDYDDQSIGGDFNFDKAIGQKTNY